VYCSLSTPKSCLANAYHADRLRAACSLAYAARTILRVPDRRFAAAACIFFARLHAAFGILAMLTKIAWLIRHSGTRLVLSHSLCNPYSRFAMFFGFPQWSDAALWKSCGCSAAPLCVTVDNRRHPAATDVQSRHAMSINQVPSRGMHFAPKTNTQMFVWLWQTDFPIRISREQSLPAHPSW
jgi:hypothetical protein